MLSLLINNAALKFSRFQISRIASFIGWMDCGFAGRNTSSTLNMNNTLLLSLGALAAAVQHDCTLADTMMVVLMEEEEEELKQTQKELEIASLPFMKNAGLHEGDGGAPTIRIPHRNRFNELMEDPNREYVKALCKMYSWEVRFSRSSASELCGLYTF